MRHDSSDEDVMNVSDLENVIEKRKRLRIKQRNRLLMYQDLQGDLQSLEIEKVIKSKKSLETLWKLHRFPGETVEEIKKRLMDPKVELQSDSDVDDEKHFGKTNDSESDVPTDDTYEDYTCRNNKKNQSEESEDEEIESEDQSNDSDEENQDEDYRLARMTRNQRKHLKEIAEYRKLKEEENEETLVLQGITANDQEISCLNEFLEMKIDVNENEVFSVKAKRHDDSDSSQMSIDTVYNVPQLKRQPIKSIHPRIFQQRLKEKKKAKALAKKNKIPLAEQTHNPVLLKENVPCDGQDDRPIICEVDGLKTYNYNHPPKVIIPKGFEIEKLSDSSNDEEVVDEGNSDSSLIETRVKESTRGQEALELKNWFPKRKRDRPSKDQYDSSSSYDPEFNESDDSGMVMQRAKRTKINSWLKDIKFVRDKNGIKTSSTLSNVVNNESKDESMDEDFSTESSDSDNDVRPVIKKTQDSEKSSSAISSMSAQNDDNEADDEEDDGYRCYSKKSKKKLKKTFFEQRMPPSSESEGF